MVPKGISSGGGVLAGGLSVGEFCSPFVGLGVTRIVPGSDDWLSVSVFWNVGVVCGAPATLMDDAGVDVSGEIAWAVRAIAVGMYSVGKSVGRSLFRGRLVQPLIRQAMITTRRRIQMNI
jgi:hypothetical protein